MQKNPRLIDIIVRYILNENFPDSIHSDVLNAVNIKLETTTTSHKGGEPDFRSRILTAYEHRCAVCGYNLHLDNSDLCIEAAHIKWRMAGGPNTEENGVALCALHHRMFDRGAFTISENLRILISQRVYGTKGISEWLLRYHDQYMLKPQSKMFFPGSEYLVWHRNKVFREPARKM